MWEEYTSARVNIHTEGKRIKKKKKEDGRDDGIISSGKAGNVHHRVNIGDRIGNCVGMFNEGGWKMPRC